MNEREYLDKQEYLRQELALLRVKRHRVRANHNDNYEVIVRLRRYYGGRDSANVADLLESTAKRLEGELSDVENNIELIERRLSA